MIISRCIALVVLVSIIAAWPSLNSAQSIARELQRDSAATHEVISKYHRGLMNNEPETVLSCLGQEFFMFDGNFSGDLFSQPKQSTASITPSLASQSFEEIFSASINAMDGENELRKIQSITARANCTGPRGNYTTEVYSMQSIAGFQAYFDRSEFLEWDDISPPLIRVSQDASMAYVIVHKRVRLKARNEQGVLDEATTIFAWMETYEKQDGKWALTRLLQLTSLYQNRAAHELC